MRTAREAFLASPHKQEFQKSVETVALDTGAEYALLAYLEELPSSNNANDDWSMYCRLQGARRVLAILREIHLPQQPLKSTTFENLRPPK